MQIVSFSYKDAEWEVQNLNLQTVNLLVGHNGTGKSRILSQIDRFVKILTQQEKKFESEEWIVEFLTHDKKVLRYELQTLKSKNVIVKEFLFLDNNMILDRKRGEDTFRMKTLNGNWATFFPPQQKLAIYSINDIIKYPFTAKILDWAENSYGFEFSFSSKYDHLRDDLLNPTDNIPELFSQLNKKQKDIVIDNFNNLGYNIQEIKVEKFNSIERKYLLIDEKDVKSYIYQFELSQGMSRSLALIIYLEFLISKKKPATIVIDDLGEGLDYIRAKELGKLVFERCGKKNIQLIATSNDSFLMDVIDIKYWNVLNRKGKVVSSFNKTNHPQLFEDFKFTGLSNFDFFSSDYIDSRL